MTLGLILELLMKLCFEHDLEAQQKCYQRAVECVEVSRGQMSEEDLFFKCSKKVKGK